MMAQVEGVLFTGGCPVHTGAPPGRGRFGPLPSSGRDGPATAGYAGVPFGGGGLRATGLCLAGGGG